MHDDTLLPSQARQVIDERVRRASEARRSLHACGRGARRHRLAEKLRVVADRLDG